MNADTLRALTAADPFHPFTLRLTSGRTIRVPHRSFITISGDGQSFTIFGAGACDTIETILVSNCQVDDGKTAA
jgi:hypothetical protein